MKKALIAMSGGVDSSVAAYFMKNNGYDCVGATMKLYDNEDAGVSREQTCCTADDIEDARCVASRLGIPYYVFNFKGEFEEKVIKNFVETYEKGGTPNPCIECNRYLKFEKLMQKMYELNLDCVVTGHYARIAKKDGRYLLMKGKDITKDQSYVLYSLTQEQLSHTVFPLGEYSKEEIRAIAEREGFINANKRDSQDICFIPDGDYYSFIKKYRSREYESGDFIDKNGNVLGKHSGIIKYTIGQRKGLGLSAGRPVYVISKDLGNNTVTVGDNEDLYSNILEADNFNWIIQTPENEIKCKAKTRYNMKEQPCSVIINGDRVTVVFDEPQRAITKGQAVVLYDGDCVLGGGTII